MGYFSSFIPEKISNKTVVGFLEFFRRTGRRFHIAWRYSDRKAAKRREHITEDAGINTGRLIEDQNRFKMISYGKSDMAYAGCEIIAVFNALSYLGISSDLTDLISHFEHDGMVFGGRFGTSPFAMKDCLESMGLHVRSSLDRSEFDRIAEDSDVSLLMFYNNRRNIFSKVHTVCLTHDERGLYAHNVYGNGSIIGPAASVSDLFSKINDGFSKGIVIIGVSKTDKTSSDVADAK